MSDIFEAPAATPSNKDNSNDLMAIMQMATMNISNLGKQMGIISSQITEQAGRLDRLEGRMQVYEDKIRIDRNQARRIRNAIHARVNELLDIRHENGVVAQESLYNDKYYKGGFISRCYTDARNHSSLGTPYTETYNKDYEEVINYVSRWDPEMSFKGVSGVAGYKAYLDERRKAKHRK